MNIHSVVRTLFPAFCLLSSVATVTYAASPGGFGSKVPGGSMDPGITAEQADLGINKVTGMTLLPSSSVVQGTDVTVRVDGFGSCTVFVETNGASDHDGGGFGDYQIGPGSFPLSQTFTANTIGNFKIGIIAVNASKESCLEGGVFAINTQLNVKHPLEKEPLDMKPKFKPSIPNVQPKLGPAQESGKATPKVKTGRTNGSKMQQLQQLR